jgi:hypothetical protein
MRTVTITLFALVAFTRVALADDGAPATAPPPAAPPPAPALCGSAPAPASNPFAITGAPAPEIRGPSVWGILPWGGLGVGARVMWPLGIPPLLTHAQVHDKWALEAGGDLLHWSYTFGVPGSTFNYSWTEIVPVVGIMWNVWLNDRLALYPKGELGYAFGWFSNWQGTTGVIQPTYGGVFIDPALGAMYRLSGGLTLRAEAGYAGLKLGAGWLF